MKYLQEYIDDFRHAKKIMLFLMIPVLFSSCYYTRSYTPKTVVVNKANGGSPVLFLIQLANERPDVILHQDSSAWHLTKIEIDESNTIVTAFVNEMADTTNSANAYSGQTAKQLKKTLEHKYYQLHLYVSGLVPVTGSSIHIENDNILKYRYYIIDEEFHSANVCIPCIFL